MTSRLLRHLILVALSGSVLILSGCGKGGSPSTPTPIPAANPLQNVVTLPTPAADAVVQGKVAISKAEFAQTHVMPENGLGWQIFTPASLAASGAAAAPSATEQFSFVGGRDALALITFGNAVTSPVLQVLNGTTILGNVALTAPAALAKTEDNGPAYSTSAWSALIPAAWMVPGVSIRVSDAGQTLSDARALKVGADADLDLRILPFYLFGANDANTSTLSSSIALPSAAVQQEVYAKWPVAKLNVVPHPIGRIDMASMVIAPSTSAAGNPAMMAGGMAQPAYVINSMNQQRDGYAVMRAALGLISKLRAANGEDSTNNQYYSPILGLDTSKTTTNKLYWLGGGLGMVGGGTGVGDYSYAGVFIHEQGHAFGLGHVGDEYLAGTYPYAGGSLAGSAWGYDPFHQEFLSPYVPVSASSYVNKSCLTNTGNSFRQAPVNGRCIKQDPMQGGSGDQAATYLYATFSDYTTARMQRWLEGTTTISSTTSAHVYSGGRVFIDANSATGYSRWDGVSKARVVFDPAATDPNKGLNGVNAGFPVTRNVPVYAIAITLSHAGDHATNVANGISQIYPPMSYTGNLLRLFDPTSAVDQVAFHLDTGTYPWYCKGSGCDYTLRVTYSDASVIYRVLKDGFRAWWTPAGTLPTAASDPINDPLNSSSFKTWVINVPATNATGAPVTITKTEVLDTPMVWTMNATAVAAASVLLTR